MKSKIGFNLSEEDLLNEKLGELVPFSGKMPENVLIEINKLYDQLFKDEDSPLVSDTPIEKDLWIGILVAAGSEKILEDIQRRLRAQEAMEILYKLFDKIQNKRTETENGVNDISYI
jgi:hypothetical protein